MKLRGLSQNCPRNHSGYSRYTREIRVLFGNSDLNLFLQKLYLLFQMVEFIHETAQF